MKANIATYALVKPNVYALVGATSIIGGYTRLSFSLAVLMLECTQNVELFIPIICGVITSTQIGHIFNPSLYDIYIKIK